MNTPAHSHRLEVTLFLASAVVTLLSSCTEVPTTAENSTPIAFCHATVPQKTSDDYETMEKREGRYYPMSDLGGIEGDVNRTADQVATEDLAAQVKIDLLTASDREQLEARCRDHPSPSKIKIENPPNHSVLWLSALWAHPGCRALAYVIVGQDGRATDVYVADCTSKLIAQVVALRVMSCHFSGLDEETLVKIQYATKGRRVEEKIVN